MNCLFVGEFFFFFCILPLVFLSHSVFFLGDLIPNQNLSTSFIPHTLYPYICKRLVFWEYEEELLLNIMWVSFIGRRYNFLLAEYIYLWLKTPDLITRVFDKRIRKQVKWKNLGQNFPTLAVLRWLDQLPEYPMIAKELWELKSTHLKGVKVKKLWELLWIQPDQVAMFYESIA